MFTRTVGFVVGYVSTWIVVDVIGIMVSGMSNNRGLGCMLRGIHSIREENPNSHPGVIGASLIEGLSVEGHVCHGTVVVGLGHDHYKRDFCPDAIVILNELYCVGRAAETDLVDFVLALAKCIVSGCPKYENVERAAVFDGCAAAHSGDDEWGEPSHCPASVGIPAEGGDIMVSSDEG